MLLKLLQLQLPAVISKHVLSQRKLWQKKGEKYIQRGAESYSRADWAEGHHPLNVVSIAATPWFPVRVLSSLQHKLLSTETGVLISDPAVDNTQMDTKTHKWEVIRTWRAHKEHQRWVSLSEEALMWAHTAQYIYFISHSYVLVTVIYIYKKGMRWIAF